MSGLGELGGFEQFTPGYGGQVQQKDLDQYIIYDVNSPSVSVSYLGTKSPVGAGTYSAIVFKSHIPDYPRNLLYQITGVAGGMGGTFNISGQDQFGSAVTETVSFASAAGGGSVQGTQIFGSVTAGSVSAVGLGATAIGTATLGFSTVAGTGGNWFGLPVKIGGTADLRTITWNTGGTAPGLNGGTNFGTLVNATGLGLPSHAFQGTAGLTVGDLYIVTLKPTFDNIGKGIMSGL